MKCEYCHSTRVYEFGIVRDGEIGKETTTYDCKDCHERTKVIE